MISVCVSIADILGKSLEDGGVGGTYYSHSKYSELNYM